MSVCHFLFSVLAIASLFALNGAKEVCKKGSPNFDVCLSNAATEYMARIDDKDGIVVDFTMNGRNLTIDNSILTGYCNYKDFKVYNSTKGTIKLKHHPLSQTITGVINIPFMKYNLYVDIRAKFGDLPLIASGVTHVSLRNFQSAFISKVDRVQEEDKRLTLKLTPLIFNSDNFNTILVSFDELKAPTPELADSLKLEASEFGDLYIHVFKEELELIFKNHYSTIASKILQSFEKDGVYTLQ